MPEGHTEILVRGKGASADLLGFYIPDTVAEALKESQWDIREMMETLAEIARGLENAPRDRMAAMKMIDEKAHQALTLSGTIQKITAESIKEDEDSKQKVTAESLRIIEEGAARTLGTLELLAAGAGRLEIIDVEPEEVSQSDTETSSDVPATGQSRLPARDAGAGGGSGPGACGGSGGGSGTGAGDGNAVDGPEWADPASNESSTPYDNQSTTRGAEDARSRRTSEQPRRGDPRGGPGTEGGPDAGGDEVYDPDSGDPGTSGAGRATPQPRRATPYTPGEAARRAKRAASRRPTGPGDDFPDLGTGRPPDGSSGG